MGVFDIQPKPTIKNITSSSSSSGNPFAGLFSAPSTPSTPPGIAKPTPAPAPAPVDNRQAYQLSSIPAVQTYQAPAPVPTAAELAAKALETPDYVARKTALDNALNLFKSGQTTDAGRYGVDYTKGLENLGFKTGTGTFDRGELATDPTGAKVTASGRAFKNLANDFAARGMLQSGLYDTADQGLNQQFIDQKAAMDLAKTRFSEDQTNKLAAAQQQRDADLQSALENAKQSLLQQWATQYAGYGA